MNMNDDLKTCEKNIPLHNKMEKNTVNFGLETHRKSVERKCRLNCLSVYVYGKTRAVFAQKLGKF